MDQATKALKRLTEHGHHIVYQTMKDGIGGHFLTLLYLRAPHFSFHDFHSIEGADFADCVVAAVDWLESKGITV